MAVVMGELGDFHTQVLLARNKRARNGNLWKFI